MSRAQMLASSILLTRFFQIRRTQKRGAKTALGRHAPPGCHRFTAMDLYFAEAFSQFSSHFFAAASARAADPSAAAAARSARRAALSAFEASF